MTTPLTYKHGYPPQKDSLVPSIKVERDPTTSDLYNPKVGGFYEIPTVWTNSTTGAVFILSSITSGTTANWINVVPSTTGTAPRKGTTTLVAGVSPTIATTAVNSASVIALTITALGTVTDPQALYVTITDDTDFVITSADNTDTSTINWSIVA